MPEDFLYYVRTYQTALLLSLPYFLGCAFIGVFLILRQASLLGLVLTKLTHVSFLAAYLLFSAISLAYGASESEQNIIKMFHETSSETHGLQFLFDLLFFAITMLLVFGMLVFTSAQKKGAGLESLLSILVILFIILTPLLNQLVNHLLQDHVVGIHKGYFTEILYTPVGWFPHYMPYLFLWLILYLIFFKPMFLAGFDREQAGLLGLNVKVYDMTFFLLSAGVTGVSVRLLGLYLTVTILLLPGYLFLSMGGHLKTILLQTLIFTIGSVLVGFTASFIFDALPSEPVFILSNLLLAVVVRLAYKVIKS